MLDSVNAEITPRIVESAITSHAWRVQRVTIATMDSSKHVFE